MTVSLVPLFLCHMEKVLKYLLLIWYKLCSSKSWSDTTWGSHALLTVSLYCSYPSQELHLKTVFSRQYYHHLHKCFFLHHSISKLLHNFLIHQSGKISKSSITKFFNLCFVFKLMELSPFITSSRIISKQLVPCCENILVATTLSSICHGFQVKHLRTFL